MCRETKEQCGCPVIEENITASAFLSNESTDVTLSVVEVTADDTDAITYYARQDVIQETTRMYITESFGFDTRLEAVKLFDSWLTTYVASNYHYSNYTGSGDE